VACQNFPTISMCKDVIKQLTIAIVNSSEAPLSTKRISTPYNCQRHTHALRVQVNLWEATGVPTPSVNDLSQPFRRASRFHDLPAGHHVHRAPCKYVNVLYSDLYLQALQRTLLPMQWCIEGSKPKHGPRNLAAPGFSFLDDECL
jgi:hypothetical protein